MRCMRTLIAVRYNLESRNGLLEPVDLSNLDDWYLRETQQVEEESIRHVLRHVALHLTDFVRFPDRALLLWPDCNRVPPEGKKQRYHRYPAEIRVLAKQYAVKLDTRPNGPARAAFQLAGGIRPERFGSTNDWTAHHLYSGKFPYIGRSTTLHAIKDCNHFTQSAGVITAHPIADAMCDEFPFFAWLLRARAFQRFGYDPDQVFAPCDHDPLGFAKGYSCPVVIDVTTEFARRQTGNLESSRSRQES